MGRGLRVVTMLNLNRTQRWLCGGAAGVIATGVVFQAEEAGLAETHWIIGTIVVVAFLGLASAKPRAGGPPVEAKRLDTLARQLLHYDMAYKRALEFVRAEVRVATAGNMFANMKIGENNADAMMEQHFGSQSSKFSYMLVYLASHKLDMNFSNTDAPKHLEVRAVGKFIASTVQTLAAMSVDDVPPRQRAISAAAKEFAQCKTAINLAIGAFSTGSRAPMDAVYQIMETGLGLAKMKNLSLEAMSGQVAREIVEMPH